MSTRLTRRPQAQVPLNNIESLLLAQAVWELGAGPNSWAPIAKILSKHPLLSRPKSFFSTQSCHSMYESLMQEAGLELNESNHVPHAFINLQLAQKHYRSRFLELQELILAEESKFKTVFKEIEDIRAGLWDKDVQPRNSSELPVELLQESRSSSSPEKPADDLFSGSDLSGVTESSESNHSPSQTKEDLIAPVVPAEQVQVQEEAPSMDIEEGPTQSLLSLSPISRPTTEGTSDEISEDTEKVEELIEENRSVAIDRQPEAASQPSIMITEDEASEANDANQPEKEAQMEDVQVSEAAEGSEKEVAECTNEHANQRQEEEEEEVRKDEESKEEEEEASQEQDEESQGQEAELDSKEEELPSQEDVPRDMEQNAKEQEPSSPKYVPQIDLETESEPAHTPTADTIASELEPIADDGQTSETEEPVAPTRRSTRRKSSATSIPPPQARTRLRSQARLSETEPQVAADSENDGDAEEVKEETPAVEDEQVSSPFDGAIIRQRDGKRKASFLESAGSPQDKKRLREDSEPVDEEEPGTSSHNTRTRVTRHATRTEEQVALKRFQNVIGMLHSQISQHRNGNIFHNPIKNSEAPDYHDIVKRPMDLKTIKTRVKDGVIANSLEYQRDIYLMFANAMMYNRPGSDVHAMAEDMMLESEGQITAFRQTEGLVKRGQRP